MKSCMSITSISIILSFWNFAQSMAVMLPCSVQNFKMIILWMKLVQKNNVQQNLRTILDGLPIWQWARHQVCMVIIWAMASILMDYRTDGEPGWLVLDMGSTVSVLHTMLSYCCCKFMLNESSNHMKYYTIYGEITLFILKKQQHNPVLTSWFVSKMLTIDIP